VLVLTFLFSIIITMNVLTCKYLLHFCQYLHCMWNAYVWM